MNTEAIVHPSEILYDMLLQSPKYLLQITNYDLFKDIILNKKDLTEQNCEFFAKVFQTSKEYWMNMQKQWDEVNSILSADKPCPDVSVRFTGYLRGPFAQAHEEGRPVKEFIYNDQPVYILSEQAYKYMLSKCTEDEMWDLGFLGQSEKHMKKVELPKPLQNKFKHYYGNGLETAR